MATSKHTAAPGRRLIRLTAVAEALDCSIDSVDRYVRAGQIPVVRLPSGRRRVAAEDLDRLINEWRKDGR